MVVDSEVVADFAKRNGLPVECGAVLCFLSPLLFCDLFLSFLQPEDIHRLCEEPSLKSAVLEEMDKIGAEAKVRIWLQWWTSNKLDSEALFSATMPPSFNFFVIFS